MKRAVTIFYDSDNGEMARVQWSDDFKRENVLVQADVLRDMADCMTACYDDAVKDLRRELGEASCKPN